MKLRTPTWIWPVAISGLAALVAVPLLVKSFIVAPYRVPQNGMYPTLPAGQTFWVSKRAYHSAADVRRGDIVAFNHEWQGERYLFVWRVIGLPGDQVAINGDGVSINGLKLPLEQVRTDSTGLIYREKVDGAVHEICIGQSPREMPPNIETNVPSDCFFMLGDNRLNALDSRYLGPVPFREFVGRKL